MIKNMGINLSILLIQIFVLLFTAVKVSFKFFKLCFLYFAHEYRNISIIEVQLEVYGTHALTNDVGADVEDIASEPDCSSGAGDVVAGEDFTRHIVNTEVQSNVDIVLHKGKRRGFGVAELNS